MNKSQKKYSSKYHLKKEFEIILNKMYIINLDFELYKNLKSGEIKKYITDYIPYTSQIILNSLFNNIILELSKIIIDNSDYKGYENICIKNLLKKYEDNKYLFKEKKYYYLKDNNTNKKHRYKLDVTPITEIINNYRELEKNNQNIINYLKNKRNKTTAHNDKKHSFDKRLKYSKKIITFEQLENFIKEVFNIINDLNRSIFGIITINTYYFKDELIWLKDLIKQNTS